ncbi:MAG: 4Fe-4S dicluster domain-containing protein [Dehalococcoidia bacterium]|nr:4Fe-4S dicluster domain-containing protein [Dehalococcoidia bacterium]
MATREIFWNIGDWGYILYGLLLPLAIILAYAVYRRYRLWQVGQPDNRLDNLPQRIWSFTITGIIDGLIHRRFLREPYPGLIHLLIFWGAIVFLLAAFLDFLSHYIFEFMHGSTYLGISFTVDVLGIALLLGVIIAAYRRYIQRPDRLDSKPEDAIALTLIFVIVFTGFIIEGLRIAYFTANPAEFETIYPAIGPYDTSWAVWSPGGWVLAKMFGGISSGALLLAHMSLWWFHIALALGAIVYVALTWTTLAHIVVGPFNVLFRSSRPKGALVPVELEEAETFGVDKISGFTWKQIFDLDACTRCGRCQDICPAYLSGKALSPKKLIQDLKQHWLEVATDMVVADIAASSGNGGGNGNGKSLPLRNRLLQTLDRYTFLVLPELLAKVGLGGKRGNGNGNKGEISMIGDVITAEVIWDCTTCRACQEVCPVFIEHIDKIIDMRRNLVLEQAEIPETAEMALRCIEERGHTCKGTTACRTDWFGDIEGVKLLSEDHDVEILYFVGCSAALEDRNMKVSAAFGRILQAAGVKFGVLGEEESCCGEPARRMGNEYLFQMQAMKNIETFKRYGVKKIVVSCPHGYNTLKNEYPQFGGEFAVVHHSQYIAELIQQGRLNLKNNLAEKITYHDACYLGRHNDIYNEPRQVVKAIPGAQFAEMARRRSRSFCCGAGGGHMWMEESVGTRISEMRTEEAISTKASVLATACPFCIQMFEDAIKAKEASESIKAMDIAELVLRAIEGGTPAVAKAVEEKPAEAGGEATEEKPADTGGDATEG